MVRLKKRYFSILLILIFLLTACTGVFADQQHVYDNANLFDATQISTMETLMADLVEKTSLDVIVTTTDDALGKTARDYADDFYDENGFGIGSEYDGILFLIDMDNRQPHISTCGSGIDYFTDARIEQMLDDAYTFLSESDYYGASENFISNVEYYHSMGIDSDQYDYNTETGESTPYYPTDSAASFPSASEILIYALIALLFPLIIFFVVRSRYKLVVQKSYYDFLNRSNMELTLSNDTFINEHTTSYQINTSSSGGSSGKSSTHTSSSGRSHGGGTGKKF